MTLFMLKVQNFLRLRALPRQQHGNMHFDFQIWVKNLMYSNQSY